MVNSCRLPKPGIRSMGGTSSSIFCWLDEDHQQWNPKVPSSTLVIQIDPAKTWGGWTTMGYNPEEWDNRPHRNQLRLGWSEWHAGFPSFQHWLAAHEIGHVFGLTHKHQRPDQEHYVHFECKNLANYDKAERLTHSSVSMTMYKLCSSPVFSFLSPYNEIGFVPHESSTIMYWDMLHRNKDGQLDGASHRYEVTHNRKYDNKSIMQYPSMMDIAGGKDQNAVQNMPLVGWKKDGPGSAPLKEATAENAARLEFNIVPTRSDCKGVKMLYP